MAKAEKCSCMPGMGLLALILITAGIYFLVWGFYNQSTTLLSWSMWNWESMLYYLIGLLLVWCGKMAKHSGCHNCTMHSA